MHRQTEGVLRAARPAPRGAPRDPLGVLRLRRRPGRPRRAGEGAALLDLRHDRRPGPPGDPALDDPADRPGVRRRPRLRAHARTPPAAPSGWTSAPPPRSSAPSGSSGTSPRPTDRDLDKLADWIGLYTRNRALLHTGRVVRPESLDPTVLLHGVVAPDRSEALLAHVQLDEPSHNRGIHVRVPGLDPTATYAAALGRPDRPRPRQHVRRPAPGGPDRRGPRSPARRWPGAASGSPAVAPRPSPWCSCAASTSPGA